MKMNFRAMPTMTIRPGTVTIRTTIIMPTIGLFLKDGMPDISTGGVLTVGVFSAKTMVADMPMEDMPTGDMLIAGISTVDMAARLMPAGADSQTMEVDLETME